MEFLREFFIFLEATKFMSTATIHGNSSSVEAYTYKVTISVSQILP